jgi:hypothetical protein
MPSTGQQIREALTTEIEKIAGIGETGSDWTLWDQVSRFPAAYTILDTDVSERLPTRSKTVTASFRIACILQSEHPENDFDDLRAAIETQIEDDPTLGGLAMDAWVSGVGSFATAKVISGQVYVRNVFVDVIYRHPRAQP